jgi:hypothetical protein
MMAKLIEKIDYILDAILADRYEYTVLEAYKNTRKQIQELRDYIKKETNGKKIPKRTNR